MQHHGESVTQLLQTTCFEVITNFWEAAELLCGVSGVENHSAGNLADGLGSSD